MTQDQAIDRIGHPVYHLEGEDKRECVIVAVDGDIVSVRYANDARIVDVPLAELTT